MHAARSEEFRIEKFRIEVDDAVLDDLRDRLRRTRWPEPQTVHDWSQGVPLGYARELCRYWAEEYDWPARQARLNDLPQFRTEIDGLGIHFVHVRSPHDGALPLIMTHGWPGSIVEFVKAIPPLVDPVAHGGAAPDAFHVVCPSLPGYGFSDKPAHAGWNVERIARAWSQLMARLGYGRYGAQGHDWGTSVSTSLAQQDPGHVVGVHLVPPLAAPDPLTFHDLTDAEQRALQDLQRAGEWEDGYSLQQATRPQTLGYGLLDSPAALCAWIIEKFRAWSDCGGDLETVFTRDELLDNLMLYWLPGTGASSARLYWESIRQVQQLFRGGGSTDIITVPTGCSIFPKENPRPSRRWAQKRFVNIHYWSEPGRGGHFAAFEQPELFVREVRACFRTLR
ncbi:MAG TPA: epoxide hydrolase [Candidatus Limnocylindrales bacterium]